MSTYKERYEERKQKREGQSGYRERYFARMIESGKLDTEAVIKDISNRVNAWTTNSNSFISDAQNRFTGENASYRADAGDYLTKAVAQSGNLKNEAESIKLSLKRYDLLFNEDYTNAVMKAIDDGLKAYESVVDASRADLEHWSKWKNEEDYKEAVAPAKEYEDLMNLDRTAAQDEITALEEELSRMESLWNDFNAIDSNHPNYQSSPTIGGASPSAIKSKVAYDYILKNYGSVDEFESILKSLPDEIAEKKAYLGRAERLQTASALEKEAASAIDFDEVYASAIEMGSEMEWVGPLNQEPRDKLIALINDAFLWVKGFNSTTMSSTYDDQMIIKENATEEQLKTYVYLYGKYGEEKAHDYLDAIQEGINANHARLILENNSKNFLSDVFFSAAAGLDQFKTGIEVLTNPDEEYYVPSAIQMAYGERRKEYSGVGGVALDLMNTTANMTPSILVSMIPYVGQVAGVATLGASAAGNAYAEMVNLGFSKDQATSYAALVGVSEAGLSYVLSGIGKLGGKAVSRVVSKIDDIFGKVAVNAPGLVQSAMKTTAKIGAKMGAEGFEEGLQSVLEPWFKSIATNTEFEGVDWGEAGYSALLGALSAGVLEGGATIVGDSINLYKTSKVGEKVLKTDGGLERLKSLGSTMSMDSAAYKIAGKVNESTGAYSIGRLFYEVGASMSEQNRADIVKSLERKGVATKDAETIATWLGKAVAGEYFTDEQIEAIDGNEQIAQTLVDVVINPNSTINQRLMDLEKTVSNKLNPENINSELESEDGHIAEAGKMVETGSEATASKTEQVEVEEARGAKSARESAAVGVGKAQTVSAIENATERENVTEGEISTSTKVADAEENPVTLESASKKYGAQVGAMKATYIEGQDIAAYDAAYRVAYDMGKSGVNLSYAMQSKSTAYLTESQRELAHAAGVDASNAEAKARDAANKAKANDKNRRRKGVVRGRDVSISDLKARFNDKQGVAYKLLSFYAEVTGIDIVLYDSSVNEKGEFEEAQGKFKWSEDTIYIDINAGLAEIKDVNDLAKYTMMRTFSHEFVHFIEKWNPIWYNEFRKVVFDTLTERGENVDDLIATKQAQSEGMSYDKASREVVAEAMTDILPDAHFAEKLATKHRNIFYKLLDMLKDFVADLKAYFNSIGKNPSREANALKEQVGDSVKYLDHIVKLFDKVAIEAVENYQAAAAVEESAEATVSETAEVVSKTENVTESEFDSDGNPIYETLENRKPIETVDFKLLKQMWKMSDEKYGLTEKQSSSLQAYIRGIAYLANERLRSGRISDSDLSYIQHIIEGAQKFPVFEGRTYRNFKFETEQAYDAFIEENLQGQIVQLKAITSTSKRPNGYPLFGKYVVHMVFEGVSGRDIADTYGIPRQQEVLFLPGARYSVSRVSVANDGHPIIFVKEVVNNEVQIDGRGSTSGEPIRGVRGVSEGEKSNGGRVLRDGRGAETDGNVSRGEVLETDTRSEEERVREEVDAELDEKSVRHNEITKVPAPKEEQSLDSVDENAVQEQSRSYLRGSFDSFDGENYSKVKLTPQEYNRVFSEALTWNADKVGVILHQTIGGYTYVYSFDERYNITIYNKYEAINIHERKKIIDDFRNRKETYTNDGESWSNRRNDSSDLFNTDGRAEGGRTSSYGGIEAEARDRDRGGYVENSSDSDGEQQQRRTNTLTDRDALYMAAEKLGEDAAEMSEAERFDDDQEQSRSYLKKDEYPTYGVHWGVEEGVMSKADARAVWEAIANIQKRGYNSYPTTVNGEYFVEGDDVLMVVAADYRNPIVETIYKFNDTYKANISYAKELIINARGNPTWHGEAVRTIEILLGEEYVEQYDFAARGTDEGENRGGKGANSRADFEGEIQYQRRTNTLTDRDALYMAAEKLGEDAAEMSEAERDALQIFKDRLSRLYDLQEERVEQGRLYKKQQFEASVDREAAARTLNRMHILDDQIKKANEDVLSIESKKILVEVLKKARGVIEAEQKTYDAEILKRYRDRTRNAVAIKKYRERIRKDVNDLSQWILKPNNKDIVKHVPAVLKNSVIPFLSSIDFTSKQQLRGGDATQADKKFLKRLESLNAAMKDDYDVDGLYSGYTDLPADFMDKLESLTKTVRGLITENSGEFVINKMTSEELKTLASVVRNLKTCITQTNKFHANAMFSHVYEAGDNTIAALAEMASNDGRANAVSNFVFWQQIRPAFAFERFGEGGKAVYDGLRRGQAQLAFNTKKIVEFTEKAYTDKEVTAWEKEIKEIKISKGIVKMRVSDIMSFYELSKQPDSLRQMLGAGMRVATYTSDGKKISDNGHALIEQDITSIVDALTPRQKEVADALQKFMQEQGGAWGNYVSVARFGEELFTNEQYFPINSDGRHLQATADEAPSAASLYALLNMSFTKSRNENANNRIVVYSIFDVFANHMASMAQYNALALPVLDAIRWLNYQKTEDVDGKRHIKDSVREQMDRVYGVPVESKIGVGKRGYAQSFVLNIIKAFSGTEAQGVPTDTMGTNALKRYNVAQVAYNFRVVVQQPLAITRAALLIDYSSIMRGMKLSPSAIKQNIKEMREYSGIAAWKALGFYDVNISRGLTDTLKHNSTVGQKISDIGMWGAEKADTMAWAAMWSACKEEVIKKQNLKPGDAGFYEAVTKLFEEVIYKTQVVDSVLTKNEYLRSKGPVARLLGSFMSEPTTTASMVVDAVDKYNADRKRGMTRQQVWKKNRRMISRTMYVYGVSAFILAAVQAVADAFRDDDDYEEWYEKWLEAFGGNLVDEIMPFNKLPILSDFYDLAKELLSVFGVDTYGNPPQSVFMQWYDSLAKGVEILYDKVTGKDTNYTYYGGIYKLLQAVSSAFGLPMATATREIVTAWNNIAGVMAPGLKIKTYDPGEKNEIKYAYQDGYLTFDEAIEELVKQGLVDNENEAYFAVSEWEAGDGYSRYDAVYEAVRTEGDISTAMDELTSHGYTEKDVLSQVTTQIGKWYYDEESDYRITKRQAIDMLSKYTKLTDEEIAKKVNRWSCVVVTGIKYDDIDDEFIAGNISASRAIEMYMRYGGKTKEKATQDVAVCSFVKEYPNLDYEDISYSFVSAYTEYCKPQGIDLDIFQKAWQYQSRATGDKDKNGNTISGSKKAKVLNYIDSLRLSKKQKDSLYYAFRYSANEIQKAPWH